MESDFLKKMGLSQLSALRHSLFSLGEEALHMISPDNFEYYRCAFELLDGDYNSVAYLSFDILPNNIVIQKQPIISIVKTISDIFTITNDSFNPFNISIQGTFGRKLRVLTSSKEINTSKGFQKFLTGNIGAFFDSDILVKTGYGTIKMLQSIIEKSNSFNDDGNGYNLVFHNYTFNEHYFVRVISFNFNISNENNFMWFYNITMTAIEPYNTVENLKDKVKSVSLNLVKNLTNNSIKNFLSDIDSHISQYGMTSGEKYTDYENSEVEKKNFMNENNPWLKI